MKLLSILSFLVVANVAQATYNYCGTVTDTYTKTKYSTSHAPTVTSTYTRKLPVCFEIETVTKTKTKQVDTTTYFTTTTHKTKTETKTARPVWTTTVSTQIIPTCTPRRHKRFFSDSFTDIEDEDEIEFENLTNGERIKRGLPLAKPNHKKRSTVEVGIEVDAQGRKIPQPPKPSCYPTHVTTTVTTTKGKTFTPTRWETTSKCHKTKTLDETVTTKTTVTHLSTETITKRGDPVITYSTITPTRTSTSTVTSRLITGACRPTNH